MFNIKSFRQLTTIYSCKLSVYTNIDRYNKRNKIILNILWQIILKKQSLQVK